MSNNAKRNEQRLMAYQRRATTVRMLREQLTERLERSYASEPDWSTAATDEDEPCPPTPRVTCSEVACVHYPSCNRVPIGDCFEVRANSHLIALSTRALTLDDPELRRLASVLVAHPDRQVANRLAQCALELGEMR